MCSLTSFSLAQSYYHDLLFVWAFVGGRPNIIGQIVVLRIGIPTSRVHRAGSFDDVFV